MGNGTVSKESALIDKELKKDQQALENSIKLLLLGSGESGKSTLAKQMKLLRLNGFTEAEKAFYKTHIHYNLVAAVGILGTELERMQSCNSKTLKRFFTLQTWIEEKSRSSTHVSDDLLLLVEDVFRDSEVVHSLAKNDGKFRDLPDSSYYLFNNHQRICGPDYEPSADDILHCRVATTGIHELVFSMNNYTLRLIDVGGQRGQRKKWITQFDCVNGMIFVTAISDYHRVLEEDMKTNRMEDSIILFEGLLLNRNFAKTSILLFFNKKDVFMKKIEVLPFSNYHPQYKGPNRYEDLIKYIESRYLRSKPPEKKVYTHFTIATDTENIKKVFKMTFDIILQENMQGIGML